MEDRGGGVGGGTMTSVRDRTEDMQAEARAMTRAANLSVYNPEFLEKKYKAQPFKV